MKSTEARIVFGIVVIAATTVTIIILDAFNVI
jgi:hypothetical protein